LEAPATLLSGMPPPQPGDCYWACPSSHQRLIGRGAALTIRVHGERRLDRLAYSHRELTSDWEVLDPQGTAARPLMFLSFAFSPTDPMEGGWQGFPNSCLILPELLVRQHRGSCRLIFTCADAVTDQHRQIRRWLDLVSSLSATPQEPGLRLARGDLEPTDSRPSNADWLALVDAAVGDVKRRRLQKLVLYRRLEVQAGGAIAVPTLAAILEQRYPDCRIFAATQGEATLVSASPERLVRKCGRQVASDALAGTAPRAADPQRDADLGRALQRSPKARLEHRLVENAVRNALSQVCAGLSVPHAPDLQRLSNVQHLRTEVRGLLRDDHSLIDVAARLHPTPAVGGFPRALAQQWLRRRGQDRRGWYCGAAGWIDMESDGELDVLLRCALVRGNQAELYAGAGVVSGSRPDDELQETTLKLRAVLDALASI
jgi:menaquinone-specific isochorismate synthase